MNKDLTVGKPSTVLWQFCLPLFGSIIFQQLYNIADSFIAGRFVGENALAAVGNSYEVTLIFIAIAFGCNIGCSIIVSKFFGSREYNNLKTAVYTTWITSAVLCAVLMTVGFILAVPLLNIINTPAKIMADSWVYLVIYIGGFPFLFFYNIATGIFSAMGDSKTPFWLLFASSISNIAVDYIFVHFLNMGVAGVALATFLCQGISCVVANIVMVKRLKTIKTNGRVQKFSLNILKQIAFVAIPSILQQSFVSVGNILLQGIINGFGASVIAGYSASVKLNNLVITSFTTLGNGISNYTSQNMGAEKPERIKSGFISGLKMVYLISFPIVILYFIFGGNLVQFFIRDASAQAIATGKIFLKILAPFYFFVATKLVADGVLRGAGQMRQFVISTFTDLILRVLLAFLLSRSLQSLGIWCSWPIGWIIGSALSVAFYLRWIKRSLKNPLSTGKTAEK